MSRTLSPSSLTLAGLVKHMALVEDHYFTHQLMDSPEELQELWLAAVRRSEAATDHILTSTGLDTPVVEDRVLFLTRTGARQASAGVLGSPDCRCSHCRRRP